MMKKTPVYQTAPSRPGQLPKTSAAAAKSQARDNFFLNPVTRVKHAARGKK